MFFFKKIPMKTMSNHNLSKNIKGLMILIFFLFGVNSVLHAQKLPSEVLNLKPWKLTLPYSKKNEVNPFEVKQPNLSTFYDKNYFFVNKARDGVVFRAYCGGATTKGSHFPRCELRQMPELKPGALKVKGKVSWSTSDKVNHQMTVTEAIIVLPPKRDQLVCAQIHDAKDYVVMIRLRGKQLYIEVRNFGDILLDTNYKLGTKFTIKLEAGNKQIKVFYNNNLKMVWKVVRKGCYFKAGCYTQSNTSKGDKPNSYGEVIIYKINVQDISLLNKKDLKKGQK